MTTLETLDEIVPEIIETVASDCPKNLEAESHSPTTPADYFNQKFPGLEEIYGPAVDVAAASGGGGLESIRDLSEDFMAATLGKGDSPVVFITEENRFYGYSPAKGIFVEVSGDALAVRLSQTLHEAAVALRGGLDEHNLFFKQRDSQILRGTVARARGVLETKGEFFDGSNQNGIACANGFLELPGRRLVEFAPVQRRRNKLAVSYDADATAPKFMRDLLESALDGDDIDVLKRWSGQAVRGENAAQKMLVLTGTAGGGKGTVVRVITGIIGQRNVGSLRPSHLAERFELGRLLGRSLLYGADVPEDFLNCKGASVLKALTGGDPVTLEFKGSNARPEIICRFNVLATCNSRLSVRLEGDEEAWRRRLAIIEYAKSKPQNVIHDLSEQLLKDEGPGILNWMLDGLEQLRADGFDLKLNERQKKRVDDLLLASQSEIMFVKECIKSSPTGELFAGDALDKYLHFCEERGWTPLRKEQFSKRFADLLARQFFVSQRHDLVDDQGNTRRGWKGIVCIL